MSENLSKFVFVEKLKTNAFFLTGGLAPVFSLGEGGASAPPAPSKWRHCLARDIQSKSARGVETKPSMSREVQRCTAL